MAHNGIATQTAAEQKLYRIGEVSRLTELKPFVLRYWESEFSHAGAGQKPYRTPDVPPGGCRPGVSRSSDCFMTKALLSLALAGTFEGTDPVGLKWPRLPRTAKTLPNF